MSDLIEIKKETVLQAFSSGDGLEPVIQDAKNLVESFSHDMSTKTSRAKTASLASKVAKLKVKLDDMGKDLVTDWKAKSKAVDSSRKSMRDELDNLKIEARKPLTEWEEEEKEKEKEKARLKAKAELQRQQEEAILMNELFDIKRKEELARIAEEEKAEAEKAERERLENEARIAQEAAAKVKLEAEELAKTEAEKVEREKKELIEQQEKEKARAEQAERDQIAAEERAKIQAEQAEKARIEAAKQAKIEADKAAEKAKQDEIDRRNQEQANRDAEEAARQRDRKHAGSIMKASKVAIMECGGVDEETAKRIVLAIKNNKIPSVSIKF